jgi:HAD superfamily hydrolase (TIGR01549 family)
VCERVAVSSYEAVLFDWSGTLVHDPSPADRLRRAFQLVNRSATDEAISAALDRLERASAFPEVVDAMRYEDTSAEIHRAANTLWFERAGLDSELADALYHFDDEEAHRPLYPDAAETLAKLKAQRVRIAVVSDIHIDIRVLLERQGVGTFVDAYVLSFEHGCQKPDPRMFLTALDLLDVRPDQALMVGDRCSHDGGSVEVGIAAFILSPPPPVPTVRGLDIVTRMAGGREPGSSREQPITTI